MRHAPKNLKSKCILYTKYSPPTESHPTPPYSKELPTTQGPQPCLPTGVPRHGTPLHPPPQAWQPVSQHSRKPSHPRSPAAARRSHPSVLPRFRGAASPSLSSPHPKNPPPEQTPPPTLVHQVYSPPPSSMRQPIEHLIEDIKRYP